MKQWIIPVACALALAACSSTGSRMGSSSGSGYGSGSGSSMSSGSGSAVSGSTGDTSTSGTQTNQNNPNSTPTIANEPGGPASGRSGTGSIPSTGPAPSSMTK